MRFDNLSKFDKCLVFVGVVGFLSMVIQYAPWLFVLLALAVLWYPYDRET